MHSQLEPEISTVSRVARWEIQNVFKWYKVRNREGSEFLPCLQSNMVTYENFINDGHLQPEENSHQKLTMVAF